MNKKIYLMPDSPERDFEIWWYQEGSGITPRHNEDREMHCHRVAKIAWLNATFKAENK